MRKEDVFPSKYFKAADLGGKPLTVTIASAPYETLKAPDGREQNKIVLYFHNTGKKLPLNLSNWDSVAEIAGDDTDEWPGVKIQLYPTRTNMGGKTVDCIRVRQPEQRALPPAPAKAAVAADFGDDVPFDA